MKRGGGGDGGGARPDSRTVGIRSKDRRSGSMLTSMLLVVVDLFGYVIQVRYVPVWWVYMRW